MLQAVLCGFDKKDFDSFASAHKDEMTPISELYFLDKGVMVDLVFIASTIVDSVVASAVTCLASANVALSAGIRWFMWSVYGKTSTEFSPEALPIASPLSKTSDDLTSGQVQSLLRGVRAMLKESGLL